MTTREHLKTLHARSAAHHLAAAKFHKAMVAETSAGVAAGHEGMAHSHLDMCEFHTGCAKDLKTAAKAVGMGMNGDSIVPDGVGIVSLADVPGRFVLRAGQPKREDGEVPQGFEKFVSIDDE